MASTDPTAAAVLEAAPPSACMNCAAPLSGHYCANCGQEARIVTPTVREFVREFLQDQVALEGKLLRTLKVLVRWPGQLTLDYVAGRRQCYIRPLRLYLTLSVVFFAVSGLFSHSSWLQSDAGDEDKPLFESKHESAPKDAAEPAAPGKDDRAPAASASKKQPSGSSAAGDKSADKPDELSEINTGYAPLDTRLRKYFSQSRKQAGSQIGRAINSDAPVAMFFLLPLFAGLLQLAYLRHHLRYGVHLLFSLHYHAFVFLDLLLLGLPWPSLIDTLLKFAIPVYLVLALRRVYGGRLWPTGFGVLALLLVYSILIGITMFSAVVVSIIINS